MNLLSKALLLSILAGLFSDTGEAQDTTTDDTFNVRPCPFECSPVILDLARDGFLLSGADPAVPFDIDTDGSPDLISWTRAGGDEAFLCLDRNRNGSIDDGGELFGNATRLRSGRPARVGYRALAELDDLQAGGNEDGELDARDAAFSQLCAWNDANRDGISQPDEIHSLLEVGVVSLSYDYKPIRLFDSYGNSFRYISRAGMRGPAGEVISWPTFDVNFFGE